VKSCLPLQSTIMQSSKNREKNFFILVPVYNGIKQLASFLEKIPEDLRNKLIFIDDGSRDGSGDWIEKQDVRLIRHSTNKGKGAALISGIREAQKEKAGFVVTLDVDLQHAPESLRAFIEAPEDAFYCGYRTPRNNMPVQRQASNFITSLLLSVRSNRIIKDSQCGFRRIPLSFFEKMDVFESGFQMESEILIKASILGYSVEHISIPTIYTGSHSAIRPFRDTAKFIELWLRSYLWN